MPNLFNLLHCPACFTTVSLSFPPNGFNRNVPFCGYRHPTHPWPGPFSVCHFNLMCDVGRGEGDAGITGVFQVSLSTCVKCLGVSCSPSGVGDRETERSARTLGRFPWRLCVCCMDPSAGGAQGLSLGALQCGCVFPAPIHTLYQPNHPPHQRSICTTLPGEG